MIDDKKIEAIVDSNINLANELVPDSPIVGYRNELKGLMVGCIKKGIQMALEDLWHDAKEKPKAGEFLYIDSFEQIDTLYRKDNDCPWEEDVETYDVVKWLQLDDILPKQKGGSNERA